MFQLTSSIVSTPAMVDLNKDGTLEVLVGSYDFKLYCIAQRKPASECDIWTTDIVGENKTRFGYFEPVQINWYANGMINMTLYSPLNEEIMSWKNSRSRWTGGLLWSFRYRSKRLK